MKKAIYLIAFLAVIAAAIYLLIKFTLWYLGGVVVTLLLLHALDKPVILAPDDPRFDY